MIRKASVFILLFAFSSGAMAEYYLVYTPSQCENCGQTFPPLNYSSHKKKVVKKAIAHHAQPKKYIAVKHTKPKVYRQANPCGQCEACICGSGHAISTSQPEFYGEYCTTYNDVIRDN